MSHKSNKALEELWALPLRFALNVRAEILFLTLLRSGALNDL